MQSFKNDVSDGILSYLIDRDHGIDPYTSAFNHQTEAEVLAYLETGWGIDNVEDLQLSFLYSPEDQQ